MDRRARRPDSYNLGMNERPASVVRELLDNALDAGATDITVRLLGGGIRAIVVEDDGQGIPPEQLGLALRRHATSKIASLHDLEGVATMGFRGEALAAIASIAEVSLCSRTPQAAHAQRLDARSGELTAAARGTGTTVEVRELFFSTPARRKFLKTDATELAHAVEAVRRHALARPAVGFAVWHEGRLVAQWRACSEAARLADVLGADFMAASRPLQAELGPLRLSGRAGHPEAARARADQQYVYVNGRFVRDRLIAHGVRSAYEDQLHGARQPAYVLFLRIAPELVDVNVHPTKIEVRFRDSREVHQATRRAVESCLAIGRATIDTPPPAWSASADPAGPIPAAWRAASDASGAQRFVGTGFGPGHGYGSSGTQSSLALQQLAVLHAQEPAAPWTVRPSGFAAPAPAPDRGRGCGLPWLAGSARPPCCRPASASAPRRAPRLSAAAGRSAATTWQTPWPRAPGRRVPWPAPIQAAPRRRRGCPSRTHADVHSSGATWPAGCPGPAPARSSSTR